MISLLPSLRSLLPGRKALAAALVATSALTAPMQAAHAAQPLSSIVAMAPVDAGDASHHADQSEPAAARKGVWGAVAGAAGSVLAAIGGVWTWVRRAGAAGAELARPVLKAAATTAKIAFGGASVIAQLGLWAGRAVLGLAAGVLGLVATVTGLSGDGSVVALGVGLTLGAAATGAAVWAARGLLFRRRRLFA